jgi:hypothetical protein
VNIARILLCLAATVLAGLIGASSAVIANQVKYPGRSAAIGIGPMGQVKANLAFASYATRQKRDPKTVISVRERDLASAAYRSEPLSSAALGILISSMDHTDVRRQMLLDLGGRLTRRSSLITSASIEAAARRDDGAIFFSWLSRAILTNENLRVIYIKAMAQATARPGAPSTLAQVIGPKPSWSVLYWNAVAAEPASRENAARLRALVAGAPWRQTEISDADRRLILGLARDGHFDALRQMASALGRISSSPANSGFVTNADFSRSSVLPPIDWQLASSGNLGATIDTERKRLSISAIAGARGYAARQLIELAPGTYELEWDLVPDAAFENKDVLTARVDCAERRDKTDTAPVLDLGAGRRRASLIIADDGCRWHWLSVNVNVPDMSAGIDAQFRRLNLKRID